MTNDDNDKRFFAYGCNEHDGTECPALAVGMNPRDSCALREMARRYDAKVSCRKQHERGVVTEDVARRMWMTALDNLRRLAEQQESTPLRENAIEYGDQVADELGWL